MGARLAGRVLIVGIVPRGDVAPYVGLGARLRRAGCEVTIATHDTFRDMVGAAGLEWRGVSGDIRSLIRTRMEAESESDQDKPGQATDRTYWVSRGSSASIAALDALLELVNDVTPGMASK